MQWWNPITRRFGHFVHAVGHVSQSWGRKADRCQLLGPHWPGQWHTASSALRQLVQGDGERSDDSNVFSKRRIQQREAAVVIRFGRLQGSDSYKWLPLTPEHFQRN